MQVVVVLLVILAARDGAFRQDTLRENRRLHDAFAPETSAYEQILDTHPRLDKGLENVRGGTWFFDLGIVSFADALAVAENVAVSRRLSVPLLLASLWLLLISLGLGRVFCSHVCPAALLFEAGGLIRKGLLRIGLPLPNGRVPRFTKYMALGIGLAAATVGGEYILAWIYPPRLVCIELDQCVFNGALRFGVLFLGGVVLLEILAFPRAWCTHLCPGGALYSLLGKKRLLRIRLHDDRCTSCGACRPVCPYDLRPDLSSPGMECDNCVRCIAACPESALSFRKPGARAEREDRP
ncbi:MAG: 4Fe-4S binding protein [Kiritimatiellia bacterium]|nr:4Fe-4S binding protein [Kiritimatiellia bacterium]MDP6630380.1 4Fe-4S binding protein [Kiritimatiellia bacterium]MDP6809837.1 4Fe-4S binding protein [Kiritimatiellia bacterium]MDP7024229.1 4Fe-4S binding protein [Kiritimatiellia bacterium]